MKKYLPWKSFIITATLIIVTGCAALSPYSAYFQGVKARLEEGTEINASVNENEDSLLHISVQNNVIKEIDYLLKHNANPNKKNKLGLTPLHYLLENNNPEADATQAKIITQLFRYKADVDLTNADGKTTLITAIQQNKPLSVEALLAAGADISISHNSVTPLMFAVQTGNMRIVKDLLAKPQPLNVQNSNEQTALHYTALADSKGVDASLADIAKILIEHGAKLPVADQKSILNAAIINKRPLVAKELINAVESTDTPDRDRFSPLMEAVYEGNLKAVAQLLSTEIDINFQDKNGWSAIHLSAHQESQGGEKTQARITEALIKAGADINLQGPNKSTPLHIAITNKRPRVTEKLLDEKADVAIQNKEGETALIKAIQIEDLNAIRQMISPDTINKKDHYGWAPIHFAANISSKDSINQQQIIETLLEHGATVNLQDHKGATALHLAIENNNLNVSVQLLRHNIDTSIKNVEGQTALMLAATQDDIDILKNLIVIPQNLDIQDDRGWTAIHYASNKSTQRNDNTSAKAVQMLINAGADTNIQTNASSSALHFSVQQNHIHVTEILSRAGANTSLKDDRGITPLILAVENGNLPIVERLTQKAQDFDVQQNDGWTALHFTAYADNKVDDETQSKIAQAILSAGANVNIRIPTGETALSIAIGNNKTLVAKTLLEAEAKTDIQDNNGWTPLMLAVYLGKIDIIREMMKYPGNVDSKNNDGMTALHLTANSNSTGGDEVQTEIAKLLLEKGANPNTRAIDGSSVLHFAAANNRENLVKALLDANASKRLKNLKGWEPRDEAIKIKSTYISNLLK